MTIAEDICEAWGWMGIESAEVIAVNKFGNVIFTDRGGRYWRICPEELECRVIAQSADSYGRLQGDPEFKKDLPPGSQVEFKIVE